MEQFCNVFLVLLSQLALWTNNVWSWLLDNWGSLAVWWERQERAVKILVLGGLTLFLGASAWAAGQYLFACPEWPPVLTAAFMIVSAIAGLFIGGKRHESAKRADAEAEAQRLATENLELRQKVAAYEYQLKRMREAGQ